MFGFSVSAVRRIFASRKFFKFPTNFILVTKVLIYLLPFLKKRNTENVYFRCTYFGKFTTVAKRMDSFEIW